MFFVHRTDWRMRRPAGPVEIDWSNPFAKNLAALLWPLSNGCHVDLVEPTRGLTPTLIATGGNRYGPAALIDRADGSAKLAISPSLTTTGRSSNEGDVTMAIAGVPNVSGTSRLIFANSSDHISIQAGELIWTRGGGGILDAADNYVVTNGVPVSWVFCERLSNHSDRWAGLFDNGRLTYSITATGDGWTGWSLSELYTQSAFSESTGGNWNYFALWDKRAFNEAEGRELSAAPFQIVRPLRRFFMVGTTAGGGLSIPVAMRHYRQQRAG